MSAAEQITLFNTLFYVFAGITALGLALAVFFFFYFDIPTIFVMITGKAKRDTIRRMEEANAVTGKVRRQYPAHTGDMKHSGRLGNSGRTAPRKAVIKHPTEEIPTTEPPQTVETGVLKMAAQETEVLRAPEKADSAYEGAGETAPLKRSAAQNQPKVAPVQSAPQIRFQITENTMVIHTDELI